MEFLYNVDFWVLLLCSFVGSMKAGMAVGVGKSYTVRVVDVLTGVICGMAVVHHFTNDFSIGLRAMVAVTGGASGAMIVEVFLQVLPALLKDIITKWIKKLSR